MSASKARQKVQITLKVIESLSYNCDDTVVLQKLDSMLNEVERKFREKLPHHEGLLLRPALITDAAKKVSLKYKKMRLSRYGSLPLHSKVRAGKKDWRHRNRVGHKADRYRKVILNIHHAMNKISCIIVYR